jgi:hypothetical protein
MPVFSPKVLWQIAVTHFKTFKDLQQIETQLTQRFNDSSDMVRALILSVASREPLLFIGPPGTAKSQLIRSFCHLLGYLDLNDLSTRQSDYFEYLLTPFTEPGELFGFYNIAKLMDKKAPEMSRDDTNMMQKAKVVYLDEIFNGSSAILNSLLAFMQEGLFHDRGERVSVAMRCLFAATNDVPESRELRAIFDRFILRYAVHNVSEIKDDAEREKGINNLLTLGWRETYGTHSPQPKQSDTLSRLDDFHHDVKSYTDSKDLLPQLDTSNAFYRKLSFYVANARRFDLSEMSNRRLVKIVHVMMVHAIYMAVCQAKSTTDLRTDLDVGATELQLIPKYFLDRYNEQIVPMMERQANLDRSTRA